MKRFLRVCSAIGLGVIASATIQASSYAQMPDYTSLPHYKPEVPCEGGLRLFGNWMKGNMTQLVEGFKKFHPACEVSTNFMTSSEGVMAGLYTGISDIGPAGDDGKITDMMPFYDTFHYVPTEISIATGGYETRGTLWPAIIAVNKDNPIAKLTMDQLSRIFGSGRTGGWEVGPDASNGLRFTAKYARDDKLNIRTWDQLGLSGEYAGKTIQTYGYVAPGFKIYMERRLNHWSQKWNENYKEYVEALEATKDADGEKVVSERMWEALSKDKFGIAWGAWLHGKDYPNVKVLAIAEKEGGPYVPYTEANVQNRSYPLKRDYYLYVNKAPGRPLEPKVREFLRFALSYEGQDIIAKFGLYYPLPTEYIQEQLKKLD